MVDSIPVIRGEPGGWSSLFMAGAGALPYGGGVKVLLVDGNYYVYRSFFAIRELSNSRGEATNAIYGFVKVLRKMLRDVQPDRAAVLWDKGLPERRMALLPTYKQHRVEMPETMRPQITHIQRLVPLMGLHSIAVPQTEADDLMAAYAVEAEGKGAEVVLATNDKDLFQLVSDKVSVYSTNKADLASPKDPFALLGVEYVCRKWGVEEPRQVGDVLALVGDSADNIPGVAGMGPKRAVALINEFKNIDNVLQNVEAIKSAPIREKIAASVEQIRLNQQMVALECDLPLPVALEELQIEPRYDELVAELEGFEFKSLTEEVRKEGEAARRPRQSELF